MRKEEIEERENRNAETILLDWIGLLGKAHYKLLNPNKEIFSSHPHGSF
jgi:hypothetical protein